MAELGPLGDRQGVEERSLRCCAPLEGRGALRGAPGGLGGPGNHERVLSDVISARWPDQKPMWPAFLEGGAVLRGGAAAAPAPAQTAAQVTAAPGGYGPGWRAQGGGRGPAARDLPLAGLGPPTQSAPPLHPPIVRKAGGRAPPPVRKRAAATCAMQGPH